ncbi:BolA family transcriptional regulator [Devosia sp. J2-20]|jgi:BolA family transcriptional regulator, general stress-responsive regulator|uniref:BolA family transcriptional regulator n=1 Tax=Devosia litorisediminis TaxID=2829817 RepID=A0A942I693_9HYPH|nr:MULTISPECIES: BolA family protein [Devosia]MBS3850041.1 BolA family transcriptional regulator [Devosia litorisediminis]WDQ99819.1 BolA family transcriptional regulator [Devosia sp. J2-20]
MSAKDTITAKLSSRFTPAFLDVIDESMLHHGHAGWREGGETHFRVRIATAHFDGLSRVAQHRAIMETLDDELKERVHALAIEVLPSAGPYPVADKD